MPFKEYQIEELKRYWTITEIAKELGIQSSAIRFWETEFPHIIPKGRYKVTKYRKYTDKERDAVHEVHRLLHIERYTIEGAKIKLKTIE